MMKKNKIKAISLLVVFSVICVTSFVQKSLTFDEIQHLPCGIAIVQTGNVYLGFNHPHLFRMSVGLPFLFTGVKYPKIHELFSFKYSGDPNSLMKFENYEFGYDCLYEINNNSGKILFVGRLMALLWGIMLGLGVYLCSRKLFGETAGLFSLLFFSFDPTIIAHSGVVVNDIAGAAGVIFTLYALFIYNTNRNIKNLAVLSTILTLSILTKFSIWDIFTEK